MKWVFHSMRLARVFLPLTDGASSSVKGSVTLGLPLPRGFLGLDGTDSSRYCASCGSLSSVEISTILGGMSVLAFRRGGGFGMTAVSSWVSSASDSTIRRGFFGLFTAGGDGEEDLDDNNFLAIVRV